VVEGGGEDGGDKGGEVKVGDGGGDQVGRRSEEGGEEINDGSAASDASREQYFSCSLTR
jgi:hypothetical protein